MMIVYSHPFCSPNPNRPIDYAVPVLSSSLFTDESHFGPQFLSQ